MFRNYGKNTSNTRVLFWESIDEMVLFDWKNCMDGKIEFVNKERKKHPDNFKQWEKLHDEFLLRFGIGEKFEKYLELIRKKSILECDVVLTNDRFKINKIEVMKMKIESLKMTFGEGSTIEKSLIHLSKWLGFHLKIKELKVVEFYEIIEEYGTRAN